MSPPPIIFDGTIPPDMEIVMGPGNPDRGGS